MTPTGLPPGDLEQIAAFLDRRLPEEERREFLDRLDSDEALYEVFVETVRYREEKAAERSNVVEHPASKDWTRWMGPAAIAAMLALVVAGPLVYRSAGGEPDFAVALVRDEGFEASLGERWYQQRWATYRGGGPSREEMKAAFRGGVLALEVEVALRLGRREEARKLTALLRRELGAIPLSVYPGMYDEVFRQLDESADGANLDEILRQFLEIDSLVRESLGDAAPSYSFGKLTEAGRLAAKSSNPRLLRSSDFRSSLRDMRAREWDGAIDYSLDQIALELEPRTDLDLEALEGTFQGIIDSH